MCSVNICTNTKGLHSLHLVTHVQKDIVSAAVLSTAG